MQLKRKTVHVGDIHIGHASTWSEAAAALSRFTERAWANHEAQRAGYETRDGFFFKTDVIRGMGACG